MRISKLIKTLGEFKDIHGDVYTGVAGHTGAMEDAAAIVSTDSTLTGEVCVVVCSETAARRLKLDDDSIPTGVTVRGPRYRDLQ